MLTTCASRAVPGVLVQAPIELTRSILVRFAPPPPPPTSRGARKTSKAERCCQRCLTSIKQGERTSYDQAGRRAPPREKRSGWMLKHRPAVRMQTAVNAENSFPFR